MVVVDVEIVCEYVEVVVCEIGLGVLGDVDVV